MAVPVLRLSEGSENPVFIWIQLYTESSEVRPSHLSEPVSSDGIFCDLGRPVVRPPTNFLLLMRHQI